MAEIRNVTRNGETFYPLTCTDAVVDRDGNPLEIVNDIFDISEYNASGTPPVLAKYSTLALALAAVPQSKQKGGMTIRYVQTSDNKYVQYFLTKDEWSVSEADWEKMNLEEEISQLDQDLKRYIFSGDSIFRNDGYINYASGTIAVASEYSITDYLIVDRNSDIEINNIGGPGGMAGIFFYDKNFAPIQDQKQVPTAHIFIAKENIPQNAVYFRSSTQNSYITSDTSISFFRVESLLQMFSPIENIDKLNLNREILHYIYNKDIFSVDNSYIGLNGGLLDSSTYKATPFLPILKDNDIVVRGIGGQSGSLAIAFYDETQSFISSFDYTNYIMRSDIKEYVVQKADIPANAKYIRSCLQKIYESDDTFVICANIYSSFSKVAELETNVSELTQDVELLKDSIGEVIGNITQIKASDFVNTGYIQPNGYRVGTYSDTKYTDFIPVSQGQQISALLGLNTQIGGMILYTTDEMSQEAVSRVFTGGQFQELTQVQLDATVLANEHYVRFCSSYSRIGTIIIKTPGTLNDLDSLFNLGDLYDYSKVKVMPKQMLRTMVESASNGKYTVIYDDNGLPSLMCKIPIISLGALNSNLGDLNTPHPAFIVNGVQKGCIYMAPFQSTVSALTDNVPVCWWGLSPTNGEKSFEQIRTASAQKGVGWHLETIYERSLAILLSVKKNGEKARGNRCYGRDNVSGYEYEAVQRVDDALPGTITFAAKWINGTQPLSWSHNGDLFGIFDLIGGYWEWTDLIKVVNGQIYLASDNNFAGEETEWVPTGVYIDIDTDGTLSFNTSFNTDAPASFQYTSWISILCKSGYDSISLDLRKKLQQLLICPRLSSTDNSPLFNFDGKFWMKKDQTNYLIHGGAEEYPGSGFGEFAISYPKTESHGNMGSRLCYIE